MMRLIFLFITILTISSTTSFTYANYDFTDRPSVQQFIQEMVKKHKFSKQSLLTLFSAVKVRPQVLVHVKKPLEKNPWHRYQILFVNQWRIKHGIDFWNKYEKVLKKAEKIYGVPSSIIVATIGIETKYGQRTGDYRVIDSLSNLAFSDSPRAPFFRKELEQFLLLTRDEHMNPLKVMGSYAGAIGQPQFMPSSYRHYAVNFSKSGKTDLMNDEVDVIGSIANYYKKHGWQTNHPVIARAYLLTEKVDFSKNDLLNKYLSTTQLKKYGISPKHPIKNSKIKVKIIELESYANKEYWLGFPNFAVIRSYNNSDLYAMAVYQLSVEIIKHREKLNHG